MLHSKVMELNFQNIAKPYTKLTSASDQPETSVSSTVSIWNNHTNKAYGRPSDYEQEMLQSIAYNRLKLAL